MIEKHIVRISFDVVYSGRRLVYTVTGDAVNLVTRPGGITKEHGADIIVGAGARDAVPEVVFSELDRARVKGKSRDDTFRSRRNDETQDIGMSAR